MLFSNEIGAGHAAPEKKSAGEIGFSNRAAASMTASWCLAGMKPESFQLWTVDGGFLSALARALAPPQRSIIASAGDLCGRAITALVRQFRTDFNDYFVWPRATFPNTVP